ncbi:MAG: hypothetical protein DRJ98_02640 [Thermoprotei archaeon]|nr:MAG: hypothetical protein DRJ98_02640 [Thermoprotei archaeon]RLF14320.1 MAG: hypothetical protein DRN06_07275 [Thermoprotei archaeon]
MVKAFFLTGAPGVGKTTAVMKVVEELKRRGFKVGGMLSGEVRRSGVRWGFEVIDLATGARGVLASVEQRTGPSIGKYRVNLHDLEEVGVKAILRALEECDVVVVDEVGPMELYSEAFKEAVRKALDSGKLVLGTVHFKARGGLVDEVKRRADVKVLVLTTGNRDSLAKELAEELVEEATKARWS